MQRTTSRAALLVALTACAPPTPTPTAPSPPPPPTPTQGPRFNEAGELLPPTDYRDWQYLTSGLGMSYGPIAMAAAAGGVQVYDTVFVARAAHDRFLATGVWPESTMFVLELRNAEGTGSIVTRGHFQTDLIGLEAAVKDSARFPGGWGYFAFATDAAGPTAPAEAMPEGNPCDECHRQHGAVEQTFTQFYPTLFAAAKARGTVRRDFVGVPPSLTELHDTIARDGWPAGERLLTDTAARWPEAALLRESPQNHTAYRLLRAGKQAEALALFEHITRRFPGSANAWDSLSEARESAGQPQAALAAVAEGLRVVDADITVAPAMREALVASLRGRHERLTPPGT